MFYPVILSISLLFVLNVMIFFSLRRIYRGIGKENNPVNISIIIAARNESGNIDKLFASLKALDYPNKMFEVIFVDDNSTDDTFEKLKFNAEEIKNFSVHQLNTSESGGKREALTLGIRNSKYSHIIITDADCRPQRNWLKSYSKKFNLGYDMLFGIAPFYQKKQFVNKLACFENLRNVLLSFSMAAVGLPYTAAARNFGFTKKTFESLEGYSRTRDTLSGDDDLLLREAVKKKLKIGVVTGEDSFVYSDTKKTLKEYLHQKARHTQTSFHYLKKHKLALGIWYLLNLAFLFSPLMMLFNPAFGILLPLKLTADLVLVKANQKNFGYRFSIAEIFYLQLLYETFLMIHFFNARFSKIKWK